MDFKATIRDLGYTQESPVEVFHQISTIILKQKFRQDRKRLLPPPIKPERGFKFTFDAVAPDGFDNHNIPTLIQTVYSGNDRDHNCRETIAYVNSIKKYIKDGQYHSLLLLVGGQLSPDEKVSLVDLAQEFDESFELSIWDSNDLNEIFRDFKQELLPKIQKVLDKSKSAIPIKALKTQFDEWKKNNIKHIKHLHHIHHLPPQQLTLFIGAGVARSAGLPDWSTLLSKLIVALIQNKLGQEYELTNEDTEIAAKSIQKLNEKFPLMEARYINAGFGDGFAEKISKILYDHLEGGQVGGRSELIQSIVKMCIPGRNGSGVKAIINYNFGGLIEEQLTKEHLPNKAIYRDNDPPGKDQIGVYHVHGFLPRMETIADYDGLAQSLLVFSEQNYHKLMEDPYYWSNLVQLNAFNDSTCLLIGLSGTDPNLRRVLEIAQRNTDTANHYILLKRTSLDHFFNSADIYFKEDVIQESVHNGYFEGEEALNKITNIIRDEKLRFMDFFNDKIRNLKEDLISQVPDEASKGIISQVFNQTTIERMEFEEQLNNGQPVKQEISKSISTIHHNLLERSFYELGLNVIWFEEFSELPIILDQIAGRVEINA